jgi:hypothetical protein
LKKSAPQSIRDHTNGPNRKYVIQRNRGIEFRDGGCGGALSKKKLGMGSHVQCLTCRAPQRRGRSSCRCTSPGWCRIASAMTSRRTQGRSPRSTRMARSSCRISWVRRSSSDAAVNQARWRGWGATRQKVGRVSSHACEGGKRSGCWILQSVLVSPF